MMLPLAALRRRQHSLLEGYWSATRRVRLLHKLDNPTAPAFVRYWTNAVVCDLHRIGEWNREVAITLRRNGLPAPSALSKSGRRWIGAGEVSSA